MSEQKQRGEVGPVRAGPGPPTRERPGPVPGAERSHPALGPRGGMRRRAELLLRGRGAGGPVSLSLRIS